MGVCLGLRQTTGEEAAVNGQSTFQVQYVHITCFFNFKKREKSMISVFTNMKIW